jgi:WXG100 family type VII secretion target
MSDGGHNLQVDQATLHQVARDIRAARTEINGHLGTVRGAAEALGAAWQGQAAAAFTNLMLRWDSDAKQLAAAMDNIADLMDRSATQHELSDDESMRMLNRVDGSVNSILNPSTS